MLSRDGLRSCEGLYEELQALVAAARINPRVASHGDELCSIEELLLWRNQDSRTVLHLACELGLYNAAAYIIRQGVPGIVNLADDVRTTPLHVAARLGHANIVELLLREGADARAMERSGITAMHHAASAGSVESILLLKHNGGDIDAYSGAGTPLHWAAGEGQSAALQQLIDLGASMVQQPPLPSFCQSPNNCLASCIDHTSLLFGGFLQHRPCIAKPLLSSLLL
mmetsp:Transcript_31014/g.87874  ORF Transcript_31014/g.87874 Transcript_31014/m.87874 type:complete len:226 (-) Transcript_31014:1736-2413(-)